MRLLHLATAISVLGLAGCDNRPTAPQVKVEDAWVQLPAVPGRPGAAYFTLTTNNDPTRLVSVSSPRVERVELHGTMMEGSMAQMRPLESTNFEDRKLVFAPGGKHAMLFGIDPSVKAGDKVALTFTFQPAPPVTVEAEVRAFGEDHGGH
jgi:copper(I)-binding protein